MRIETTDTSVQLVEFYSEKGQWAVRWDFEPKPDTDGIYWYEEEVFNYIPTISDIQQSIMNWFNKQTDGVIQYGFEWKGINVLLNDENKFNYKAITDEAARIETAIAVWDKEHPELSGVEFTYEEGGIDENGNSIQVPSPTGRPKTKFPITLKLGSYNTPENFYVFTNIVELQEFFSAGVDHLLNAYASGWYKISTFDWSVYVKALEEL